MLKKVTLYITISAIVTLTGCANILAPAPVREARGRGFAAEETVETLRDGTQVVTVAFGTGEYPLCWGKILYGPDSSIRFESGDTTIENPYAKDLKDIPNFRHCFTNN